MMFRHHMASPMITKVIIRYSDGDVEEKYFPTRMDAENFVAMLAATANNEGIISAIIKETFTSSN